jgi:hypothetical protein
MSSGSVESTVNIKITGDVSDVSSKLEQLKALEDSLGQGIDLNIDSNGNISFISDEIESLKNELYSGTSDVYTFADALNNLATNGSVFKDAETDVDNFTSSISNAETDAYTFADALNNLATNGSVFDRIADSVDNTSNSLNNISASSDDVNSSFNNILNTSDSIKDSTDGVNSSVTDTGTSVTSIITGLNQGVELVEKIYDACVDLSDVAYEIEQSIFEMSEVLGGETTDAVINFTESMEDLYGLDATTLLTQLGGITTAVAKMGLSSEDAIAVTENLGMVAENLGAISGDFDKAFSDIARYLNTGRIGTTSSLYNILSKDEIDEMKSLDSEIERFNYLMSKSDRIKDAYTEFLGTANGKIYLLNQSFESLKSNISQIAKSIYANIAPVLTKIINGLNNILNKIKKLFGITTEAFDYDGISSDFSDSMDEIADSADAASRSIASFDDVIQINNDVTSDASSGGLSGLEDFDAGAVDDNLDEVDEKLQTMVERFHTGLTKALDAGNFGKAQKDIEMALEGIKNKVKNIFAYADLQTALDNMEYQWAETFGAIVGAAKVTGANIEAGLLRGTDKWLKEDSEHIKDKIIDFANAAEELGKNIEQAAINWADFSTVFNSEGFVDLTASFERLGFDIVVEATILGTKLASGFVSGFNAMWEQSGPDIKSAVETTFEDISVLLDGIDYIIRGIGDDLERVIDTIINPAIESAGKKFGEYIVTPLSNWWEEDMAPIFSELGTQLQTLWDEHLQPMFEKLEPLLKIAADMWLNLCDIGGTFTSLIIDTIGPAISDVLSVGLELIIDLIGDVADKIGGVADVIVGFFNDDQEKINEGFESLIKGMGNVGIDIVNRMLELIFDGVNNTLSSISKIAKLVNIDVTFNTVETPQIPKLATGGIVTKATNLIAGENGAEAVLPLENNTGWMDTLATKIAKQINTSTNNGGSNITIKLEDVSSGYMTRSDKIKFATQIVESLRIYGVNVQIA